MPLAKLFICAVSTRACPATWRALHQWASVDHHSHIYLRLNDPEVENNTVCFQDDGVRVSQIPCLCVHTWPKKADCDAGANKKMTQLLPKPGNH